MVSLPMMYPYEWTTYLIDGPDPMCRTNRFTVYSRSIKIGLFGIELLLGKDIGTSKVDVAFGCVGVLCGRKELFDVGIAGACVKRMIDTVLGITLSSIVTVCYRTLITRKCPMVRPSNLW